MDILLYFIALIWIALGALLVLYTERTKAFLERWLLRDNPRWVAPLPLVFGAILVVGAFYQREMFWLAFVLGMLGLLKGLYLALAPSAQVKRLLQWWFREAGERTTRLFGLISLVLGSAILSYL